MFMFAPHCDTGRLIPASLWTYCPCSCLPHTGRLIPSSLWTYYPCSCLAHTVTQEGSFQHLCGLTIRVHVCPTQEGSFHHLCGLTIHVHVCPTQEGSFQHLCGLTIHVHVCPTQEGSFQHLCGLHLWPGRHGPALCPLPTAGVCPLKPLRPGLPHWRLPVCQGRAADGRELQAAHLSALLQHLPSGTFSQSMAGLRLWLLLCVVQCRVVMNWFVGKLSW